MSKIKKIKILNKFKNDGKKFQTVLINGQKKLNKFFNKKEDSIKFTNELNGYKF